MIWSTASVAHTTLGKDSGCGGRLSAEYKVTWCGASGGSPPRFKSQHCQVLLNILCSYVSQTGTGLATECMVPQPAPSAPPGSWLEMQNFRPYPDLLNQRLHFN